MSHHRHEGSDPNGVWVPCPTCWGQRRLLRPGPAGSLLAVSCPACLGLGERLEGGGQVRAPAA